MPKPNVDSTVIRLTSRENPRLEPEEEAYLFAVVRASFNQRRKTLVNGLSNASDLNVSKDDVKAVLGQMGLSETVRGETFELGRFIELAKRLRAVKK